MNLALTRQFSGQTESFWGKLLQNLLQIQAASELLGIPFRIVSVLKLPLALY